MIEPRRAWSPVLFAALAGMVACAGPPDVRVGPDDAGIDRVWVCLSRGDVAGAAEAVAGIEDPVFSERAQRDVQAAVEGRPAALVACLDAGSWLAARYDASDERALDRLSSGAPGAPREQPAAAWLERAARSGSPSARLSALGAALGSTPGGAEALALEVETLLGQGRLARVPGRLGALEPKTARLRLAERRLQAATGQAHALALGVLDDLEQDAAVPESLALLEEVVATVPLGELESRVRTELERRAPEGWRMARARDRLRARLAARDGQLARAAALLEELDPRLPAEDRWLRRWQVRLGQAAPDSLEERIDVESFRDAGDPLALRRLADEWSLAARASYRRALEDGEHEPLDAFVERLDAAAGTLPGSPVLARLPRHDYGVFGERLDTESLRAALGGGLLLLGKALGLPADAAWFDVERCAEIALPAAGGAGYLECHVRDERVPGFLASQGHVISGAGIDRLVYLDLDEVEIEERFGVPARPLPRLAPRPARGAAERRALDEPLDVVLALRTAARRDAGPAYFERLLETLSLHEQKHILDFQEFIARGVLGKLAMIVQGGLLPQSIRVAIERRAQLHALRHAADPRIALHQAVAQVPVEGRRRRSEHAVAYERLVAEFLELLDREAWAGAEPLGRYGIDRGASLLQQLDRLPPETVRAIALALDD